MQRRPVLIVLASVAGAAYATQPQQVPLARRAAAEWLALIDAADSASSWARAASTFRKAVTAQQWALSLTQAREPFGPLLRRTEARASFTTALPGMPDGQYVVIEFDASFANKASARETVALMLDADQGWRVAGYFIR